MATADQLSRLEAPAFDFELRLYAGGKYGQANLDNLVVGAAYSPTVETTLSADVDRDDVVINVADASSFSTGSILIHPHPNGEVEEHEIVGYSTKSSVQFSNLQRGDMVSAFSGMHSSGATVSEWVEITNKVYDITSLEIEDRGGIVDWRATLVGTGYDSVLLSNDTAILCMWRFSPKDGVAGTWTDWEIGFLGYIRESDLTDTNRQEKSFRATVGGFGMWVGATEMNAQHFGRTDLAAGKTVTVSSVLDDPAQEAASGEFVGSPEFNGDNLVDGDTATLWISDGAPTLTPDSPLASFFSINEVYREPEPGYLDTDYQWVEIHYKANDKDRMMKEYKLVADCTVWKTVRWVDPNDVEQTARHPSNNYVVLDKIKMMSDDGSFAIITSNLPRFLERWSAHGASYVLDWRQHMVGDFEIDPTGDFVAIHYVNTRESIVWWDGGRAGWALYDYQNDGGGPGWTGPMVDVTSVPDGHSIRRSPTGNKSSPEVATNFVAGESHPTPGNYLTGDPEWAMIDLGDLGITLAATLSSSETTEMELTATLGLTEGPGYVQIDSEIIKYETRDEANSKLLTLTRGQYSTTPAEHPGPPSASSVSQYENGASTPNHLISSVSLRRRPVLASGTNQLNVPSFFEVYTTELTNPIMPDSEDWDDDWELYWTRRMVEPANAATFWQRSFEPIRARKVLFNVHEMTDGGRVKLNEIHVYANQVEANAGYQVSTGTVFDGQYSGHVIQHLLTTELGLDSSLFTMTDEGRQFEELDLVKGKVDRVIRDLCKRTGCQVVFGLDHSVEHRFDPLYPLAVVADTEVAFDRDNARKAEASMTFAHNVSQVTLRASDPTNDEVYEVTYPATPLALGSPLEMDGYMIGSADEAKLMADRIFHQRNSRIKGNITTVGPAEWLRPGMRCTVTWDMDEEGALLNGHNFVIASVHYRLKLGRVTSGGMEGKAWDTTIRLKQLDF